MESSAECRPIVELPRLPRRPPDAHKGTFGTAVIVAGSRGMAGAAVLAGRAALHSGAGLVRVACPVDVWDVVAAAYPAYMTWGIPQQPDGVFAPDAVSRLVGMISEAANAVAIGPGLGRRPDVVTFVRQLLKELPPDLPVVVDADGLFALSPMAEMSELIVGRGTCTVLTPHPGEFARLSGWSKPATDQQRREQTIAFARQWRTVLLLKGSGTLVCDGTSLYCNSTGNPGMATAGSGDVLTGVIVALLAQGLRPMDAAVLGAWVHGRAGDWAARRCGQIPLTATDLWDALRNAWMELESDDRSRLAPAQTAAPYSIKQGQPLSA